MIKLNNTNIKTIVIVFSMLMLISTLLTLKEYFTTNTPTNKDDTEYTTFPPYVTKTIPPSVTKTIPPSVTKTIPPSVLRVNNKMSNLRFLKSFGKEPEDIPVPNTDIRIKRQLIF